MQWMAARTMQPGANRLPCHSRKTIEVREVLAPAGRIDRLRSLAPIKNLWNMQDYLEKVANAPNPIPFLRMPVHSRPPHFLQSKPGQHLIPHEHSIAEAVPFPPFSYAMVKHVSAEYDDGSRFVSQAQAKLWKFEPGIGAVSQ